MNTEKNMIENGDEREVVRPGAGTSDRGRVQDDSAFLSGLNLRMKNADWNRYERGSEAFFDIDHDLERLAKESPEKATELWTENAPPGMRKPFYLSEELEKGDPERDQVAPRGQAAEPAKADSKEKGGEYEIPDSLKKKYLAVESGFYFRDAENKLAFKDRGRNLVTEHNDPDIAKAMVEVAEAKGWSKINVKGHDDFKREVWLQASLKGIEVGGYKPKDVDLARLDELQKTRPKNMIEQDESRDVKTRSLAPGKNVEQQSSKDVSARESQGATEQVKPGVISGKLLEHGPARFDFNDKNDPSYFVKVETPNGTKLHWGIDLQRAMGEAKAQIGEQVELERLGKKQVVVQEKQFDKSGAFTGMKEVDAERVAWEVKGEKAIAERNAAQELQSSQKPEKAPELNGDYKVVASVMADVLKEKGYSTKTIDKALVEAAKRLDDMRKDGHPAPAVKQFDKNAPREVVRDKMQSKNKDKDVERTVGGR